MKATLTPEEQAQIQMLANESMKAGAQARAAHKAGAHGEAEGFEVKQDEITIRLFKILGVDVT